MPTARWIAAAALLALMGCDETPPPVVADGGTDAGPEDLLRDDCESLVPEFCALPFPSDYFLADDSSTVSGHRLAIGESTLPRALVNRRGPVIPTPLNERDGWSINATLLAYLPGATATGLPGHQDLDASLADGSATILFDPATGTRVPHFSEIDESVGDPSAPRALMIRPVVPLEHSTRYVVAVRGVVDSSGAAIAAPATFAALRDDSASDVPSIEARRDHFATIFSDLETAGIARADLQLAWDFTTGSLENDTAFLISARDQALAVVGDAGPSFTINEDLTETFTEGTNRDAGEDPNIRVRIYGMMTVPLYLDDPDAGGVLNLGADGMPAQNGTAEYPFVVNIPHNASPENRMRPIQYGHGLLGSYTQANAGWLSEFGNENGFIPFGVDWAGMAETDYSTIILSLTRGELHLFRSVPERLVQGIVNSLLAMRMMRGGFGEHPLAQVDGQSVIDTSAGFYTGDSQGGIFGATYMAVTTDVTRGILGVPGQPYNLLLNRSVDFDQYLLIMRNSFRDGVDIQIAIAAMQMMWDRVEPGSYSTHIRDNLFPNTPQHEVILQPAIGDYQVTTLGAHVMARAVGAVTIAPQTRPIWGLEEVTGPHNGSAIVEFMSTEVEPVQNIPPGRGLDNDPHGSVRKHAAALAQTLHFFETGEIIHTCDGPCDLAVP